MNNYMVSARDKEGRYIDNVGHDFVTSMEDALVWAKSVFGSDYGSKCERVDVHSMVENADYLCSIARPSCSEYFKRNGWKVSDEKDGIILVETAVSC